MFDRYRRALVPLFVYLLAGITVAGCGRNGGGIAGSGASPSPPAGGPGRPSTSATVDAVSRAIKSDSRLSGVQVQAAEENGAIRLSGTVQNLEQKDRAEQAVIQQQRAAGLDIGVLDYLWVQEAGTRGAGPDSASGGAITGADGPTSTGVRP